MPLFVVRSIMNLGIYIYGVIAPPRGPMVGHLTAQHGTRAWMGTFFMQGDASVGSAQPTAPQLELCVSKLRGWTGSCCPGLEGPLSLPTETHQSGHPWGYMAHTEAMCRAQGSIREPKVGASWFGQVRDLPTLGHGAEAPDSPGWSLWEWESVSVGGLWGVGWGCGRP